MEQICVMGEHPNLCSCGRTMQVSSTYPSQHMYALPGDSDDIDSGGNVSLQPGQFMGTNVSPTAAIFS